MHNSKPLILHLESFGVHQRTLQPRNLIDLPLGIKFSGALIYAPVDLARRKVQEPHEQQETMKSGSDNILTRPEMPSEDQQWNPDILRAKNTTRFFRKPPFFIVRFRTSKITQESPAPLLAVPQESP